MPNGGSDCCGTCWFNSVNKGVPGYPKRDTLCGQGYCEIRSTEIPKPFWTYCANHPHHNPDRVAVPVGPVYVCDNTFDRYEWLPSLDTAAVRLALVSFLNAIPEQPRAEYPSSTSFDEQVIDQLMKWDEKAAIPGLRRVLQFDPFACPVGNFQRVRAVLVGHAVEALGYLARDSAISDIRRCIQCGLASTDSVTEISDLSNTPAAIVRYHATRALRFCSSQEATRLLREATQDSHSEVAAFASGMLQEREKPDPTY